MQMTIKQIQTRINHAKNGLSRDEMEQWCSSANCSRPIGVAIWQYAGMLPVQVAGRALESAWQDVCESPAEEQLANAVWQGAGAADILALVAHDPNCKTLRHVSERGDCDCDCQEVLHWGDAEIKFNGEKWVM